MSRSILIIDDEESIRKSLGDALADEGYSVRTASGGEQGIERLRAESADLVILPMVDGELGVQPSRAPLIGRLGAGELRLTSGTTTKPRMAKSSATASASSPQVITTSPFIALGTSTKHDSPKPLPSTIAGPPSTSSSARPRRRPAPTRSPCSSPATCRGDRSSR